MTVTTYGYRLMQAGDLAKGTNGWFPTQEFNVSRLDGHSHNGVDSALLQLNSFAPYTTTILAAGWSLDGAGPGYVQTVTVPVGIAEVNNYMVKFVFTAPVGLIGQTAPLTYARQTATTYKLYCNDNTAAFTAVYR